MMALLLLVALATPPPLVPAEAPPGYAPPPADAPPPLPPPAPGYAPPVSPLPQTVRPVAPLTPLPAPEPPAEEPPARVGVTFAPVSLFALCLIGEVDVALVGGLDLFGAIGGGPLGQFLFEAGLRYYPLGRPMEGWFAELRASGFMLPAQELFMMSPGMEFGHAWRRKALLLSVGFGFATWTLVSRGGGGTFFGATPVSADVLIFPGMTIPNQNIPAVQPTIRFQLGFAL